MKQVLTVTVTKLFLLLLLPLTISATKHSVVGDNYSLVSDDYNNGYPESKYHSVLDTFISVYTPLIAKRGGSFHILRDFSDGAVNAWAWRTGDEYHLEVPGGMSRYYLISEEGFISTICHELGHLLGGAPLKRQRSTISLEGQSDYFAGAKCLKRILSYIQPYKKIKNDPEVEEICSKNETYPNCRRALSGMKSLTSYYAKLENTHSPNFSTPASNRVATTLKNHPKAQCRLDTMKNGYLCPVDFETPFSVNDLSIGACHSTHYPEFARPRCWFKR